MKKLASFLLSLLLCMSALAAPPQALGCDESGFVPTHNAAEAPGDPDDPKDPAEPSEPGKSDNQGNVAVPNNAGPGYDHESH